MQLVKILKISILLREFQYDIKPKRNVAGRNIINKKYLFLDPLNLFLSSCQSLSV